MTSLIRYDFRFQLWNKLTRPRGVSTHMDMDADNEGFYRDMPDMEHQSFMYQELHRQRRKYVKTWQLKCMCT